MPVGNEAAPELMPTPEQRKYMIDRIRYLRSEECDIPFYPMDFQNDGEFVGGCIAGGRNYFHINSAGDAEPCVFIHYSNANIHDQSILEILHSPLFMAYHNGQPFNKNHLRPCPMLENPELLQKMVHDTGAHSTDLQSPESVDHLCEKCRTMRPTGSPWRTRSGPTPTSGRAATRTTRTGNRRIPLLTRNDFIGLSNIKLRTSLISPAEAAGN